MHDDLYDFFYEALPGYEQVGYRETNLVCWGCFDDPDVVDYDYTDDDRVGPRAAWSRRASRSTASSSRPTSSR